MLEFCPMCNGLLMLKEENNRNIGFCRCGFKRTAGINLVGEDANSIHAQFGEGIIDEQKIQINSDGFLRVCEKCGFDKAEAFQILSNESEVTIFKCLRCGNSLRQSQGSSKA